MGKVKNIIIFALLVLIVGAVAFLHFKLDIFGLKDDSLKIDRTALIIEETKKISEFTSAHFYEEIVVKKERVDKGTLMNTRNEVVIIARGNVRAGFNLSRLEQGSFKIQMLTFPHRRYLRSSSTHPITTSLWRMESGATMRLRLL